MKLNINIPSEMVDSKLNIQKTISTSILVLLSISSIVLFKTLELNNIVCSVGVSLGCIGAVLSFLQISKLQDFIYKPTGSKMVNTLYEFSFDKMEEVKKMIHKKEFSKLATEMKNRKSYGFGMKIHIAYSLDNEFVAYQIYKYVPFQYEAYTEVEYIK